MTFQEFKNIQLLNNWVNKIKNNSIRNWCINFFNLYNLTIRITGFILISLICGVLFFVLRSEALNDKLHEPKFNLGMGLSMGSDWPQWVIYFIKILMGIFFIILSFSINKWYLYLCIFIIGINSIYNVIDKSMDDWYHNICYFNTVVDYIYWPAFNFTNNIADIFIVSFVIVTILLIIIYMILMYKKDKKYE